MALKLKTAENNAPVIDDAGRIIYVDDEGKELPLDPVQMYEKITVLGNENKKHREKNQQLLSLYKPLEGIENVDEWVTKAKDALSTVENLNDKDWMKAEKVEKLKKDMSDSYEEKLKQKDVSFSEKEKAFNGKIDGLSKQIRKLLVSNQFANSKYFNGESPITILPPDIAEDHFGKHFVVEQEEGKDIPIIRAYYANGDPVLSKVNPGDPAGFEEAIGLIIDKYPKKDSIMRSASSSGSGGTGGTGGDSGGVNDLGQLSKQLDAAKEKGDVQTMIALKNRMADLRRKNRAA